MLTLTDIGVRFGGQILYQGLQWQLHPRGHYGLVGSNGSGKSTLLRIMSGESAPVSGRTTRISGLRIGTLGQDHFRFDAAPVLDVVLMGRPALWNAMNERAELLASGTVDAASGERLAALEHDIAALDGYQAEAGAAALLAGLGIAHERHRRPMRELSGGLRLRALLAQTLFAAPDLLLLDEPTNHLDIASIRWLEGYLRDFKGAFVVISHDRHFLNAVCDSIADLDYQELRLYTGNYDAFEAAKQLASTQREAEIARTEQRIEELQEFIDRFRAKATKARQASARKKQVERMELPEVKRSTRRTPAFRFEQRRPSGREALVVQGLSKAYGTARVLHEVEFTVQRGEKVAVVGPNGIGKSTLINIITGAIEPDAGSVRLGHEVTAGHFAQNHQEVLRGDLSVYDWLTGTSGIADVSLVRGTLGAVLLGGDDAQKRVTDLSGGESARLLLASLMLRRPNLLLLDEPTNHLDLEGREELMRALHAFEGTVLFVSHDRHFVSQVGTRVLALSADGVDDFAGNYEEYLARQGPDYLGSTGARRDPVAAAPKPQGREHYAQGKDRRRSLAQLRRTVDQLERDAAALEAELSALDTAFADPEYYLRRSHTELAADAERQTVLKTRLAATVAAWESAATDLDSSEPGS